MKKTITFVTSNTGKAAWLERALGLAGLDGWKVEAQDLNIPEIQSDDIFEISMQKAKQAYAVIKRPLLVMDGGVYINELNGYPGPFAKYMIDQMGLEKTAKLVSILDDRSFYFMDVITYIDEHGQAHQLANSTGDLFTLTDQIWPTPHPKQWSFLWQIMIPSGVGMDKVFASLSEEELQEFDRRRASRQDDISTIDRFTRFLKEREEQKAAA